MKSISHLSIGIFCGLSFGHALLADSLNFSPALGSYPGPYSHLKNPWRSASLNDGWDGWHVRPDIRRDLKFNGQPYARPSTPAINFSIHPVAASPELSQGFFRPAP
jgi:hypothetical protein